ncbi:uncharacterized protein PGTG_17374 [Puccinia graminis f. sp. tritici CRL 75-36-700-3]|uniref:Uncharacterized protein n=1 Tax=Puccinia graminis f. sp. tritici (strain CRL 75-36-700-3 / race SCCL) TaxID=418459 RepID=E3L4E3_PUCGT|nr:uncharacterized protein PGTG_17374 [Puccinia graminis f. sp. tritici CRL 75-36-700-3]EFP91418.2 hypothetical protein PGTG_17374 [Puccinia graminis f. sp. tritici CRL 75-36-700-3]
MKSRVVFRNPDLQTRTLVERSKPEGELREPEKLEESNQSQENYPSPEYPRPLGISEERLKYWDLMIGGQLSDPKVLAKFNEQLEKSSSEILEREIGHDNQLSPILRESRVKEFLPRLIKIFLYRRGIDFKNRENEQVPYSLDWLDKFRTYAETPYGIKTPPGEEGINSEATMRRRITGALYNHFKKTIRGLGLSELELSPKFEEKHNALLGNQLDRNRKFLRAFHFEYSHADDNQLQILRAILLDLNSELERLVNQIHDGPHRVSIDFPSHINSVSCTELDFALRRIFFLSKNWPHGNPSRKKKIEDSSGLKNLRLRYKRIDGFLQLIDKARGLSTADEDLRVTASRLADFRNQILKDFSKISSKAVPEGTTSVWLPRNELDELLNGLQELNVDRIYSMDLSDYQMKWLGLPPNNPTSIDDGSRIVGAVSEKTDPKVYKGHVHFDPKKFHPELLKQLEAKI